MFLEKDAVLSLKQDDVSSTYYAKYHYLSKNVNNITFYFQYEKDGEIIQDVLGSYEINNNFDIKNIFTNVSAAYRFSAYASLPTADSPAIRFLIPKLITIAAA